MGILGSVRDLVNLLTCAETEMPEDFIEDLLDQVQNADPYMHLVELMLKLPRIRARYERPRQPGPVRVDQHVLFSVVYCGWDGLFCRLIEDPLFWYWPHLLNRDGDNLIHSLSESERTPEALKKILSLAPHEMVNAYNDWGFTPFHVAVATQCTQIFHILTSSPKLDQYKPSRSGKAVPRLAYDTDSDNFVGLSTLFSLETFRFSPEAVASLLYFVDEGDDFDRVSDILKTSKKYRQISTIVSALLRKHISRGLKERKREEEVPKVKSGGVVKGIRPRPSSLSRAVTPASSSETPDTTFACSRKLDYDEP